MTEIRFPGKRNDNSSGYAGECNRLDVEEIGINLVCVGVIVRIYIKLLILFAPEKYKLT